MARLSQLSKFANLRLLARASSICIQPKDSPYWVNLGSAGGLAVACDGMPLPKSYKTKIIEGKEVTEPEYEDAEPCPFKAEGKILGWRIMLPARD